MGSFHSCSEVDRDSTSPGEIKVVENRVHLSNLWVKKINTGNRPDYFSYHRNKSDILERLNDAGLDTTELISLDSLKIDGMDGYELVDQKRLRFSRLRIGLKREDNKIVPVTYKYGEDKFELKLWEVIKIIDKEQKFANKYGKYCIY
jgi:hypothetical protein